MLIINQARTFGVLVTTLRRDGSSGGLKGKKAPGDAHPYLVLFLLVIFICLSGADGIFYKHLQGQSNAW